MSFRMSKSFAMSMSYFITSCLVPLSSWADQTVDPRSSELEEITVTAAKRNENLQQVSVSVTAISAATLETQGITSFNEYMGLVPGLADYSGGAVGHGMVILRGLSTGYYSTANTASFYIDDIPFSATSPLSVGTVLTPDPGLVDLDHIEVLNGPQATLYGASTLGGLIKVVTNKPDLTTTSGSVRTDGSSADGGGLGFGLEGVMNVPLIQDVLALRGSVFERETPGYMTDTTLNLSNLGDSKKEGGRIALRWVPQDNLDIQLSAFLQSLKVNGFTNEYVNLKTLVPVAGPYTFQSPYVPTFHTTYEVYNLSINYTAGSIGKLTNSTSYGAYRDSEMEDYTPYVGALVSYAPTPIPSNAAVPLYFGPSLKKFSDELRFSANRIGDFEWLAGLFFTREEVNYPNTWAIAIPPSAQPIPGPDGIMLQANNPATYKEDTAFADLTYYLRENLDLTVGGRYSHNEQTVVTTGSGFAGSGTTNAFGTSDTDFNYQVALRWRLTPALNTYARVATSYRPGGPQLFYAPGDSSFKPDSLTDYEVGLKGVWLNDTLRTNLAIYYMDWKDVQLTSVGANGLALISNAGAATSKGLEFSTQFVPFERLNIGASLAYTDAALTSVSPGVTTATGAQAGDSLPFTPKWAGSATADYMWPLSASLNGTLGATYRYQGSKDSDYPADTLNTNVRIPAYDTFEIRTGLNWTRYKAQFRVANLFNERGFDTVAQQRLYPNITPPSWAAIIPPRTFMLSLSASF
jgi:iron complex outermembrane recepter protein